MIAQLAILTQVPTASTLLTFLTTAVAFCVVPGPNVLYIVARALVEGRRSGLASVAGVATAALVFLALLPQFVDPARGSAAAQVVVLSTILLTVGIVNDGLYAIGAGVLAERLHRRPAALRHAERLSGLVYIALGLATVVIGAPRRRAGSLAIGGHAPLGPRSISIRKRAATVWRWAVGGSLISS